MNKKILLTICLVFFIAVAVIVSAKFVNVNAKGIDTCTTNKEYFSIEIQPGDTLWSIATKYMGPGYKDIDAYVKDIKEVNGIKSDSIHSGNSLIIPTYAVVEG